MSLRFSCLSDRNYIFLITIFENQKKILNNFVWSRKFVMLGKPSYPCNIVWSARYRWMRQRALISIKLRFEMENVRCIEDKRITENERDLSPSKAMNFINSMLRCMRPTFLRRKYLRIASCKAGPRGKIAVVW